MEEKKFGDVGKYEGEIRRLVPGYDLMHELVVVSMQALLPVRGKLLVVGAGTGRELVRIAMALPGWEIEAVDPSEGMCASALELVEEAGLGARVRVRCEALGAGESGWDAAVSLLVAHLIPDDGSRFAFWKGLGRAVRPGGLLFLSEMEAVDEIGMATWCAWAEEQGCEERRVEVLKGRLRGGFPLVSASRVWEMAREAGFRHERSLLRALGVVLEVWRRDLVAG